eukprot:TRINITY_DN30608_c0_g1_i1.p1 TRINITY_DN30608_c0_g1~~TRINITY_DN30608_c0_g1_i1.p1  ORF type:complete len:802 (+),score=126.93 TRINITY_DN30608_c0_g1_i1:55-2460(+)
MPEEDEDWKIRIVDAEAGNNDLEEDVEEETIEEESSAEPIRPPDRVVVSTKMYRNCKFLVIFYTLSLSVLLGLTLGCLAVSLQDDDADAYQIHSALETLCDLTNHLSEEYLLYSKELVDISVNETILQPHIIKTNQYIRSLTKGVGYTGKVKDILRSGLTDLPVIVEDLRRLRSSFPPESMGDVIKDVTSLILRLLVLEKENGDVQLSALNSVLLLELYTATGFEEIAFHLLADSNISPELVQLAVDEQLRYREMQSVIMDFLEPLSDESTSDVIESFASTQTIPNPVTDNIEPVSTTEPEVSPKSWCLAMEGVNEHYVEESVELHEITVSVVTKRDRDHQIQTSVWITCIAAVVTTVFICGLIIKEYSQRSSTETAIKKDFDPDVDFSEMVTTYCDAICSWKLSSIPTYGTVGNKGQMELHLCKAVSSLSYLKPFVPPWLFTNEAPQSVVPAYNAETPVGELIDDEPLARKESCSTNSDGWKGDDFVVKRRNTTDSTISLKLGLEPCTMILIWVSNQSLNSIDTIVPSDTSTASLESCCESYLKLLVETAADYNAKLLSINPFYSLFGYRLDAIDCRSGSESRSQASSKAPSAYVEACHFALKLIDRYDEEAASNNPLRESMGTPDSFPQISIASGPVRAGIVTTGTFKTFTVIGEIVPFGLSTLLVNKTLGTRVLIDQTTRGFLKEDKSVYSIQCGVVGTNVVSELVRPRKTSPGTRTQRSQLRQFFLLFKRRKWRQADIALQEYINTYEGEVEKEDLLDTRLTTKNVKITLRKILTDKSMQLASESSSDFAMDRIPNL